MTHPSLILYPSIDFDEDEGLELPNNEETDKDIDSDETDEL